jgi:hypothetical protein
MGGKRKKSEMKEKKKDWKLYADISALFSPFRKRKILKDIFENIPAGRLIYGSDFPNPAKGRKESFLRVFLRFSKRNLINRYYKITVKWLRYYGFNPKQREKILTRFHRVLETLGRGHLIN